MKQKKKVAAAILQIITLTALLFIRFSDGITNQFIIHSIEVLIAVILLVSAENMLISLVVFPLIIINYLKLISRYIRFKSFARKGILQKQPNRI